MTTEESRFEEINKLHETLVDIPTCVVVDLSTDAARRAIRIGELLTQAQRNLPEGEWRFWLQRNVWFSRRKVRNYMAAFTNSEKLKSAIGADMALKWQKSAEFVDMVQRCRTAGHEAEQTGALEPPKPQPSTNAQAEKLNRRTEKLDELEKQMEIGIEATFRNLWTFAHHRDSAPENANYISMEEKFGRSSRPGAAGEQRGGRCQFILHSDLATSLRRAFIRTRRMYLRPHHTNACSRDFRLVLPDDRSGIRALCAPFQEKSDYRKNQQSDCAKAIC